MDDPFNNLKNEIEMLKKSLNDISEEVDSVEVEEIKKLLKKYDVKLKVDTDDADLIIKYKNFYDQLKKFLEKKRIDIKEVEDMINAVSGFQSGTPFAEVLNKKKDNTNEVIGCINRIVERIREIETLIYNNKMKGLDDMKESFIVIFHINPN